MILMRAEAPNLVFLPGPGLAKCPGFSGLPRAYAANLFRFCKTEEAAERPRSPPGGAKDRMRWRFLF